MVIFRRFIIPISSFFVLAHFIACNSKPAFNEEVDHRGVVVSKQPVWSKVLSDNGWIFSSVDKPHLNSKSILITGRQDTIEYIGLLNPKSNKIKWKIMASKLKQDYIWIPSRYIFSNYLIFNIQNEIVCIDYYNGDIDYSISHPVTFNPRISGIDTMFFVTGGSLIDSRYGAAYVGSVKSGKIKEFLTPNFHGDTLNIEESTQMFGEIWDITPFPDSNNSINLIVNYERYNDNFNTTAYVGVYNYTNGTWLWDNKIVSNASRLSRLQGKPIIDGNVFYQLNQGITCVDISTGAVIWNYIDSVTFTHSNILIWENNLVTVDELGYVVAFNKTTGEPIWKSEQLGAFPSQLFSEKGIMYYISGSTHNLYALDLTNGELLWNISSPDLAFDHGAFFRAESSFIPNKKGKKGFLIASSYRGVHCFELIK